MLYVKQQLFHGILDAKPIERYTQTTTFANPFCYWLQMNGVNRMNYENEVKARVGIIGLGAVGSAFAHAMSFFYPCVGYDIKGKGSWNEILKAQVVFICVQTPGGLDDRLDCSAVDDVLSRLTESRFQGWILLITLSPQFRPARRS